MNLDIDTPPWAIPLLSPSRYKGAHGGRGSGKSHFFAELLVEEHVANQNQKSVCIREVQKSIKMSAKLLIENKIEQLGVGHYFEVQEAVIKSTRGSGIMIFQGMQNHTADSIKSLEGFDRAWVEEAQSISQRSLDLLRPTIRKPESEIWFSWNPQYETDPVDVLLRGENPPDNTTVINVNYSDNPWFPDVLREEMEYDRRRDYDKYLHVWEGQYQTFGEALVFRNWSIEEFDAPPDAVFRLGADWGFAIDPTVLIRCFIIGRKLFVDHEAYKIGCEITDTPALFDAVPDARRWPITADSARPETISYMKKNGYPRIQSAAKGAGSVEDGIEWLKSFDLIVHPRCKHTISELSAYRYKQDKLTGAVLPIFEDKNNHLIDALRYACEGARRGSYDIGKML
jgi:phage terminase large subunit